MENYFVFIETTCTSYGIVCPLEVISRSRLKVWKYQRRMGKIRLLGIPTIEDRIAQMVVRLSFEPLVEPIFYEDLLLPTEPRGNRCSRSYSTAVLEDAMGDRV